MARRLAAAPAPSPVLLLVLGYTVFAAQHEVVGSVAVSALFTNYLVPANLGSLGLLAAVRWHVRGRFLLVGGSRPPWPGSSTRTTWSWRRRCSCCAHLVGPRGRLASRPLAARSVRRRSSCSGGCRSCWR